MSSPRGTQRAQVTIGDVAAAAGVSRSTVSRAFSRTDLLSQQTVDHVRFVAHKLGYIGNQAARALSTGHFGNIAVVVPDIANPFFPPLVRAVQSFADRSGFAVFLGDSDESAEREAKLATRLGSQVDGFILASSRLSTEEILDIARARPVVLVNRDIPGIPRVLIDSSGGITEAVAHLKQLGHTRIAYLSGPRESWSDHERRAALSHAASPMGVDVEVVELGRPSYAAARDAVSALVASGATAAIAFDDVVAHGVLAGLAVRGVNVPSGFSVVGCDDTLAAATHPALTTISAASAAAGEAAVGLLMARLESDDQERQLVRIGTHLVVRSTTDRARVKREQTV